MPDGERDMRVFKTTVHLLLSALFTGVIYFGGPALTLLGSFSPRSTFELVDAEKARPPVWVQVDAPVEAAVAPVEEAVAAPVVAPAPIQVRRAEAPAVPEVAAEPAAVVGRPNMKMRLRRGLLAADVSSPPPKPRPAAPKCAEPPAEIQPLGADAWRVERAYIESFARDWEKLESLAAVYRHKGPDGRPDGFRVRGIRCGSPLHQGGLRNGDVVNAVNGREVTTILEGLLAWRKLRNKDVIRVHLTRAGQRLEYTYQMID